MQGSSYNTDVIAVTSVTTPGAEAGAGVRGTVFAWTARTDGPHVEELLSKAGDAR